MVRSRRRCQLLPPVNRNAQGSGLSRHLDGLQTDRRISVALKTNQFTVRATIHVLVAHGVWQLYTMNSTPIELGICSCATS